MENSIQRTRNYKNQVAFSFIFKGTSVLLGLWQIALLYQNLDLLQFSIWTTVISFTNWVLFFDIGIGNGLRNKVSEALVKDTGIIKIYVSNAYVVSIAVSSLLLLITVSLYFLLNWNNVYNTTNISNHILGLSTFITLSTIAINLTFNLVIYLLYAQQKSAFTAIPQIFYNGIFVLGLYMMPYLLNNILSIAVFYCCSIIFSGILSNVLFYIFNKTYLPNFALVEMKYIRELFSVSFSLFFISLGSLVLYFCDNIIIVHLLGPQYVGDYNIFFRLYFAVYTALSLSVIPLWSAASEAYLKKDYLWIKKRLMWLVKLIIPLIFVLAIITLNIDFITKIWLKKSIVVDVDLLVGFCMFVVISHWNHIFSAFLNGINNLRTGVICTAVAIILNFVLSYYLGVVLSLGTKGIIYSTVIAILPFSIAGSVKTWNLLK